MNSSRRVSFLFSFPRFLAKSSPIILPLSSFRIMSDRPDLPSYSNVPNQFTQVNSFGEGKHPNYQLRQYFDFVDDTKRNICILGQWIEKLDAKISQSVRPEDLKTAQATNDHIKDI